MDWGCVAKRKMPEGGDKIELLVRVSSAKTGGTKGGCVDVGEPIVELAGKRVTRGEGKASTCSDRGPHEVRAKRSENERAPFCLRSPIPSPTRSLVGPCSRVVGRLLPFLSSLPLEKSDKWGVCISRDQLTDETLSRTHALTMERCCRCGNSFA